MLDRVPLVTDILKTSYHNGQPWPLINQGDLLVEIQARRRPPHVVTPAMTTSPHGTGLQPRSLTVEDNRATIEWKRAAARNLRPQVLTTRSPQVTRLPPRRLAVEDTRASTNRTMIEVRDVPPQVLIIASSQRTRLPPAQEPRIPSRSIAMTAALVRLSVALDVFVRIRDWQTIPTSFHLPRG
jgi:hypothetical protein